MDIKRTVLAIAISSLLLVSCGNNGNTGSHEYFEYYTVTWENYDGTVLYIDTEVKEGTVPVYKGEEPKKPSTELYSYTFTGWLPEVEEVNSDMTFTAKYTQEIITYTITYDLNGGVNSQNNPSTYTARSSIDFRPATRTGYDFAGWYLNGERISGIKFGSVIGDITLEARWTPLFNRLTVKSQDTSRGIVTVVSGTGYSDETIMVEATPLGEYVFYGWYEGTVLLSKQGRYTFNMPTYDLSLTALFLSQTEKEEYPNKALGITPVFDETNKTVTYGLYPQKHISNPSLISLLDAQAEPSLNGLYSFDNEYYAKLDATPRDQYYDFDDGERIVEGKTYWFKCDPINWRILDNNKGEYYLLSSLLLDTQIYALHINNYEESYIRSWLGGEFYNLAFRSHSSYVLGKEIDNSASTTYANDNPNVCKNTYDKVFLPSYKDYKNTNYGFTSTSNPSATRVSKTTDWARAKGSWSPNASYWTRSPSNGFNDYGFQVGSDGSFSNAIVSMYAGVRPAIYFSMEEQN